MTVSNLSSMFSIFSITALAVLANPAHGADPSGTWEIGEPIVTYWAGPSLTEEVAKQMAEGGWNLVWCGNEEQLDIAHKYGLRALFNRWHLFAPDKLDEPAKRAELDALIDKLKSHPALYSYYIKDEPNASDFPWLGRVVKYLQERDPENLGYINLFPTYANNKQLGTEGDTVTAYREHLRQYMEVVKPELISYDHYHFSKSGDGSQYFLNIAMIRKLALDNDLPFLNIVQACGWASMRVPVPNELRWLVYTSLAYGAQGISYFKYLHNDTEGGMVKTDGSTTELYDAAKVVNPQFVSIASELKPLRSLGAYHTGMLPMGAEKLPDDAEFRLDPQKPAEGFLLGYFGKDGKPSHVLVVNLNYSEETTVTLVGPGELEIFDIAKRVWSPAGSARAKLSMLPGGGQLVRLRQSDAR